MVDPLLTVHVLAGTTGLLLGPVWLLSRRQGARAWPVAAAYQSSVTVVSSTGAALALDRPGLAWLLPVAVLTQALAVAGALARRRNWPGWTTLQPHLLGGSYIALITALLVAETGNPLFWFLPALIGQVPITMAKRRLHSAAAVA
jgi:CHASE2 domain-containing sensor protein